jgi:subtilase family serine protease
MRTKGVAVLLVSVLAGLVPIGGAGADSAATDVAACGPVPAGYARCFAVVRRNAAGSGVSSTATPVAGITPQQLKAAYRFPTGNTVGQGRTIAIVSAFDAPSLEHDLGVFSKQFGLPSCTVKTGCLTVLDDDGGTTRPPVDGGWALETTLDTEWVHAVAPAARIVVVEADDNSLGSLFRAVLVARDRAPYVSNSWGAAEFSFEGIFDEVFTDAPSVSFFFGTGDSGAPGAYPAASPFVTAVGGTSLLLNSDGTFKKESGWSGSGGGCSQYESATSAQTASAGYPAVGCGGHRALPDVSSVADPATGAAIYNTTPGSGTGWEIGAGTSLAAPVIAARAAITRAVISSAYLYGQKTITYRDITVGNNGFPCTVGYDLVTGNGSWIH